MRRGKLRTNKLSRRRTEAILARMPVFFFFGSRMGAAPAFGCMVAKSNCEER